MGSILFSPPFSVHSSQMYENVIYTLCNIFRYYVTLSRRYCAAEIKYITNGVNVGNMKKKIHSSLCKRDRNKVCAKGFTF